MYHILLYDYIEDVLERRPAYRDAHLKLLTDLHERGLVPLAGAWDEPVDGAAIVFNTGNTADIESFVASDPYVQNGLVKSWRIRTWNVVIGSDEQSQARLFSGSS